MAQPFSFWIRGSTSFVHTGRQRPMCFFADDAVTVDDESSGTP